MTIDEINVAAPKSTSHHPPQVQTRELQDILKPPPRAIVVASKGNEDTDVASNRPLAAANFGDGTCCICIVSIDDSDVVRKIGQCGHVFHAQCVETWLSKYRSRCPMCKVVLKKDPNPTLN